ncbi:MAG: DUF3551 domain-containing protein [Bradyrhizobium sp.]
MRILALTILTAATLLTTLSSAPAAGIQDRFCLQGIRWGYPGNCQFSTYAQCRATASGTADYCGLNPQYAFAQQRRAYRGRY